VKRFNEDDTRPARAGLLGRPLTAVRSQIPDGKAATFRCSSQATTRLVVWSAVDAIRDIIAKNVSRHRVFTPGVRRFCSPDLRSVRGGHEST